MKKSFIFSNISPLKIDRNKLFKGHSLSLSQDDIDKKITLTNSYYDTYVSSTYHAIEDKTETILSAFSNTPKWLQKLTHDVDLSLHDNIVGFVCRLENITVSTNNYNLISKIEFENPGIAFGNHYDNIQAIKEYKHVLPKFKSRLKELNVSDIMNNLKIDRTAEYGNCYLELDEKLLH